MYFFDGSEDGFLTAFLQAFHDENALLSSQKTQLIVGEQTLFVSTDSALAKRARERLLSFDKDAARDLTLLLRCGQADSEQVAFNYLRTLAQRKSPVKNMLANRVVFIAVEYMKKVALEIHRFHGFIRFMESASGALYAPFSPDNDIVDRLVPHFRARLPQYPFVLHDVTRKKAAVYDGKNVFIAPLGSANVLISANEEEWKKLWQKYYVAVNIPSRERKKQMRGYMPVRYWKFLPETQLPLQE